MTTNQNLQTPTPIPQYRVVCELCHKMIFFSGEANGETFSVLCDECAQSMV